jgi:hypothetical protein
MLSTPYSIHFTQLKTPIVEIGAWGYITCFYELVEQKSPYLLKRGESGGLIIIVGLIFYWRVSRRTGSSTEIRPYSNI